MEGRFRALQNNEINLPRKKRIYSRSRLSIDLVGASLLIFLPPLIFEEYTYYLYTLGSPQFFNFSGERLWFDIGWFVASGAIGALLVGRKRWLSILPPIISTGIFVIWVYSEPLCFPRECYISSTDGLGPFRDYLFLASLAFLSANSVLSNELFSSLARNTKLSAVYAMVSSVLLGNVMSFFPIMHLFTGVTSGFPLNYLQWFVGAGPPAFAGALLGALRGPPKLGSWFRFLCGVFPLLFSMGLTSGVPCSVCYNYETSAGSLILLGVTFSVLGVWTARKIRAGNPRIIHDTRRVVKLLNIAIFIAVLIPFGTFLFPNYEMSVLNNIGSVSYYSFSPLEVGHSFVYSGGFLAIPRITTRSVGITLSFGNTNISSSPSNFLAAGIGDQSPNCCKDGLDLAYRADAVMFSNGTEALLARAWWACDVNIACDGYSWQQILHYGSIQLPKGTLSRFLDVEMNWTSSNDIEWFYRARTNGSVGPWISYSLFIPPSIQNHYFDAGLYFVGPGNHPAGYAYFYQFGVSSAYPIKDSSWNIVMQCPKLVINRTWECLPSADFISGVHSFWKVLYTFGESYTGVSFDYIGNHTVSFRYSGHSPADGTEIWSVG